MEDVEEDETVDSPPQTIQYEELLEVVTHVVARLNINWPTEKLEECPKSKLDECFQWSRPLPRPAIFPRSAHRGIQIVGETLLSPSVHPFGFSLL